MITNADILPSALESYNDFDLIPDEGEFDYYELLIEGAATTIQKLEPYRIQHKQESVVNHESTSRTRHDTFAEFASVTVQKKMRQNREHQVSIQQVSVKNLELIQEQELQLDTVHIFKQFPPFNESATSARDVYPLQGVLALS